MTLFCTMENGYPEMLLLDAVLTHMSDINLLLADGAHVNAKDYKDRPALTWAKKKDYTAIIELLLEHGATE